MLIPCHDCHPKFTHLGMRTPQSDFQAVAALMEAHQPKIVIEIGCWAGAMTRLFCEHAERVYSVDHFQGSPEDQSRVLLERHGGPMKLFRSYARNLGQDFLTKAFPIVGDSRAIASLWPAHIKADLIYIDAAHDYKSVKADIAAWLPHVRQGGVLSGHDYGPLFAGVVRAVDEIGKDGVESLVWHKVVR